MRNNLTNRNSGRIKHVLRANSTPHQSDGASNRTRTKNDFFPSINHLSILAIFNGGSLGPRENDASDLGIGEDMKIRAIKRVNVC